MRLIPFPPTGDKRLSLDPFVHPGRGDGFGGTGECRGDPLGLTVRIPAIHPDPTDPVFIPLQNAPVRK